MARIYAFDEATRKEGFPTLAGVDEAGRGPLAGPVVAAAVILKQGDYIRGLKDSKLLTHREIESLFWKILARSLCFGLGIVGPREIDRMNIVNATKKAMEIAVADLAPTPDLVLVDCLVIESCSLPQRSYIRGESTSASIAAASVIAKYTRDSIMDYYHILYPQYGFDRHKGYATRLHRNRIHAFGPCPIHRTSYSPVATIPLFPGDE
ncbi:MAG: ribonuclease HII [bacterium]